MREASANLLRQPVTRVEKILVNLVVIQISSVFEARANSLGLKWEGLRRDVGRFISLPISKVV